LIDHWEDGYESDSTNPSQSTTEVWGDGDASNGCAPITGLDCTDANDTLSAGTSIVVQNEITMPRDSSTIFYDGGDRIQSNYPLAITRGSYPREPGSLMAGAVEVLDTSQWGLEYTAPVGSDVFTNSTAFEYSAIFIMASEDATTVTMSDGSSTSSTNLDMGENLIVNVTQNYKITADKPVQADLVTGDIGDKYELRWFSVSWNTVAELLLLLRTKLTHLYFP
jgi:hypothetical protein